MEKPSRFPFPGCYRNVSWHITVDISIDLHLGHVEVFRKEVTHMTPIEHSVDVVGSQDGISSISSHPGDPFCVQYLLCSFCLFHNLNPSNHSPPRHFVNREPARRALTWYGCGNWSWLVSFLPWPQASLLSSSPLTCRRRRWQTWMNVLGPKEIGETQPTLPTQKTCFGKGIMIVLWIETRKLGQDECVFPVNLLETLYYISYILVCKKTPTPLEIPHAWSCLWILYASWSILLKLYNLACGPVFFNTAYGFVYVYRFRSVLCNSVWFRQVYRLTPQPNAPVRFHCAFHSCATGKIRKQDAETVFQQSLDAIRNLGQDWVHSGPPEPPVDLIPEAVR